MGQALLFHRMLEVCRLGAYKKTCDKFSLFRVFIETVNNFLDHRPIISIKYHMIIVRYLSNSQCMAKVAVITLITALLWGTGVQADNGSAAGAINSGSNTILLKGEIIADEISRATGVAISPILGISVLGAYIYYTTPVEKRDKLPWHAKPPFWVPLLTVLLGIILKDSSKIALPKIILMPLDAIETLLEKNASAALGLLVVLSSITEKGIEQLRLAGHDASFSLLSSAHAADSLNGTVSAASTGLFEMVVLYLLVTVVFGLVWVVSQSFNFLMFLCPFSWIDLLLATFKNSIVVLLVGAYLINPFLGLFAASVIIIISLFLFARSYRFVIFGTIFSSDILFKKSRKNTMNAQRIKAFAGSAVADVPSMSYGFLAQQDSALVFHYKPWLIRSSRSVKTSFTCDRCEVGKGTLSPIIITPKENTKKYMTLFRLRPLYHSHERRVAEILGLNGVRDVAFGKTLREGFAWLAEQLGLSSKTKHEAA